MDPVTDLLTVLVNATAEVVSESLIDTIANCTTTCAPCAPFSAPLDVNGSTVEGLVYGISILCMNWLANAAPFLYKWLFRRSIPNAASIV